MAMLVITRWYNQFVGLFVWGDPGLFLGTIWGNMLEQKKNPGTLW